MPSIIIVCTANICRSPVAEALLRDRLKQQGLEDWRVSSAGTWAMPGESASTYGQEIMTEQGLDISGHQSRSVDENILADADLALCMTGSHAEALRVEFPRYSSKIYLLTEMSGRRYDVADPYGGPRTAYERMVNEVTNLIDEGLPRIIELAQQNARDLRPTSRG